MITIASLNIPKFFSAYRVILGSGYDDRTTGERGQKYILRAEYVCGECGTSFIVDHKYKGGFFCSSGFSNSLYFCPYCSHKHENFERRWNTYTFRDKKPSTVEAAAQSMDILLQEFKDGLILRIAAPTITMHQRIEDSEEIIKHYGRRFEEIRFNIKKQETIFSILTGSHRTVIKRYAIGNPFDCSFYEDSLLRSVRSDNLSEESRAGIVTFLKTVRDSLRRKWKTIHGYDFGSIFVSYGQVNGRMLFPIMNFAFRLKHPDAPNLPSDLNGTSREVYGFMTARMITKMEADRYLTLKTQKGMSSISCVIRAFNLPDKPKVRKLLSEDFFAAPELTQLFEVTDNLDCATQIWNLLRRAVSRGPAYQWAGAHRELSEIYPVLKQLARHYPIRSVISLLKRETISYIMDIHNMLRSLVVERHADAWKVKLKSLHDWLVNALKEQTEKGYSLHPSEEVKHRLAMQMNHLKFFLPEHTAELVHASDVLQNCVRTYAGRVYKGECNIVLMTDDEGNLVACLEICEGALRQAKLKFNRRVATNTEINKAVIDWCKKAKIKICTDDVQQDIEIKLHITTDQGERVA